MRQRERGETLVELLVSSTLLGIISIGLLGALATSITTSDRDRSYAGTETVVRTYAGALDQRAYKPCTAGSSTNPYSTSDLAWTPPSGYTASVTAVKFWNGVSGRPGDTGTNSSAQFQTTCPTGGDQGLQSFDLKVARTDGKGSQTLTILRRKS